SSFNDLTANFADEEYGYVNNAVRLYDIDHAKRIGGVSPRFEKGELSLCGTSTKSQAARICTVRLREEIGGRTEAEQRNCRDVSFRTTVLALASEPGKIGSITHSAMPGGYGEFRMMDWRLRQDMSLEINGRGTTDSMYDLVSGPKPADVAAAPVPTENIAPADWNFEVATDQDGVLFLKNFSCKTAANAVDRGVFEVYYVPEDEIWVTIIDDTMSGNENDKTMGFAYEPLRDGDWALVEDELMYIQSVQVSPPNFMSNVLRGSQVFGTAGNIAAAHQRNTVEIQSVDPDSKAIITLPPSLSLKPGFILYTLPAGEWQYVSEYDPATGRTVLALPYDDVTPGMFMFWDARIYRVTLKRVPVAFGASFLRVQDRARFQVEIPMAFGRVVAVRGYLETRAGLRSNVLTKWYQPDPIRTLGTTQYLLTLPDVQVGSTTNAFNTLRAETTQSFQHAFAKKKGGAVGAPIEAPRTVASATPTVYQHGGTITLSGTPQAGDQVFISIGDPATEAVWMVIPPYTCNTVDGLGLPYVAQAITNWLNGTEEFLAFYRGATPSGAEIRIVDKAGVNGELTVQTSGGISAVAAGIAAVLGLNSGRRYALTFQDTVNGWESDPGPLSYSTGPTGGASQINLTDLPRTSPNATADHLRIWAPLDGTEVPLYLVADVALGTDRISDTLTETDLALESTYPGPSQPAAPGAITILVKKDGGAWFELRIPEDAAQSNVIHGYALNNISRGTEITVDVDNQAETVDLDVIIE
ncbi:MAG TPA: hypothetical protein VMY69_07325, partial [Phycisphaerae bacterium]|nr:hypothetical protein [Phycisphaerae bacterium]